MVRIEIGFQGRTAVLVLDVSGAAGRAAIDAALESLAASTEPRARDWASYRAAVLRALEAWGVREIRA